MRFCSGGNSSFAGVRQSVYPPSGEEVIKVLWQKVEINASGI
jgi:hypothetical protein